MGPQAPYLLCAHLQTNIVDTESCSASSRLTTQAAALILKSSSEGGFSPSKVVPEMNASGHFPCQDPQLQKAELQLPSTLWTDLQFIP